MTLGDGEGDIGIIRSGQMVRLKQARVWITQADTLIISQFIRAGL